MKQKPTSFNQEIPEWKIQLAYFYAENKVAIKRALIFLLFFADVIVVFIFGKIFVDYQAGITREANMLNDLTKNYVNSEAVKKLKPASVIIENVTAVPAGNKYNLLAEITNPNKEWVVKSLTYAFRVKGELLDKKTTFLLPESTKTVMHFNAAAGESDGELVIMGESWQRISDYSLLSYKDGIKVDAAEFKPSGSAKFEGLVVISITNETPYSFWEVGLPIVLIGEGGRAVGADYQVVSKLLSRETRQISVAWNEKLPSHVREIRVLPEINLIDEAVIMKIEAGTGSPPGRE